MYIGIIGHFDFNQLARFSYVFSELHWRNVAKARVTALGVVENFDVLIDCRLCVSSGDITLMENQLVLKAFPKNSPWGRCRRSFACAI